MKTLKPAPMPAPEETPDQEPTTPARPRRRTIQPIFVRTVRSGLGACAGLALMMALGAAPAAAQSTPATPPATGTQQPPAQQGWVMFDDRLGSELELDKDQLDQLRDVDMRLQKDYRALGEQPWTRDGYVPLSERRTQEVRRILSPGQYERWNTQYNTPPLPPPPPGDLRPGTP